jgi:hypothetical protein
MNSRLLPASLLLFGLLLTGCSTFNEAELGIIRGSGVSSRVYAKMADERELRPEDVIELTRRRVPERYIVRQIDDVGVDYVLTKEDYRRLKNARVSPAVIEAMVQASNDFSARYAAPSRRAYFYSPSYYDDPFLYGDPYPYWGGSVGIGFSSGRYWDRGRHHHHHHHR